MNKLLGPDKTMNDLKTFALIVLVFVLVGPLIPLPANAILDGQYENLFEYTLDAHLLLVILGFPIAVKTGVGFAFMFLVMANAIKKHKTYGNNLYLRITGLILGFVSGLPWGLLEAGNHAIATYERNLTLVERLPNYEPVHDVTSMFILHVTSDLAISFYYTPAAVCGLLSALIFSRRILETSDADSHSS